MYFLDSFILGVIQGITEFLPVSSTAHAILISKFCLTHQFDKTFFVMLNIGTLLAIITYFWEEVMKLTKGGFDFILFKQSENRKFFLTIVIANIPTIIIFGIAELLKFEINSTIILSINLILFGILLYYCDCQPTNKQIISRKDAICVGIAQLGSLIPGCSRLGLCLSMCRFKQYNRWESFKFSILLSIPPVIGACFLKILKLYVNLNYYNIQNILVGIISAFVFGIITLELISRYLKKHTFKLVVIYRIILGLIILSFSL